MTSVTPRLDLVAESPEHADPVKRYLGLDGEWRAGVRPANVIETAADIEWLINHRETAQIRVVCRWCNDSTAIRSLNEGLRWWNTHSCAQGLAA